MIHEKPPPAVASRIQAEQVCTFLTGCPRPCTNSECFHRDKKLSHPRAIESALQGARLPYRILGVRRPSNNLEPPHVIWAFPRGQCRSIVASSGSPLILSVSIGILPGKQRLPSALQELSDEYHSNPFALLKTCLRRSHRFVQGGHISTCRPRRFADRSLSTTNGWNAAQPIGLTCFHVHHYTSRGLQNPSHPIPTQHSPKQDNVCDCLLCTREGPHCSHRKTVGRSAAHRAHSLTPPVHRGMNDNNNALTL